MSEYRVIITETLKRAVTVEAESREEAEEAVRRQYQNSEHILVAEDFDGVSFSAQYPEQQVELPYYRLRTQAINIIALRLWSAPAGEVDSWLEVLSILENW